MFLIKKLNRITVFICFILIISTSYAQEIVSVKTYKEEEISQKFGKDFKGISDISALKIVYSTTGHKGEPTIASGLLLIPKHTALDKAPFAIYEHGTTSKRDYVPSELNFQADYAANLALNNYITIAPDYIGLGESPGLHPYLHAETEATATLDMIRATRCYFKDSLNTKIRNDIYITGYSQGGHAAMATHKYIEENKLTNEFRINASAPCSGPYSLSKVMYEYILYLNEIKYCDPEIIVHTIIGYQYVYGDLYTQTGDYFKEPYDSIVDSYIKNDCNFELNDYFPVELSKFIQDSVIVSWKNNLNNSFLRALQKNDLYNWKPEAPLRMYYSKADEKVPYQNAIMTLSEMKKNGATNVEAIEVSSTLDHNATMDSAMQLVLKWFNETESGIVSHLH